MRWTPIAGYEHAYEVSDCGQVKRIAPGPHTRPGKILKPRYSRDGYIRYTLTWEAKAKIFFAHRLVWLSFVGDIPVGLQINHKNGIRDDNRLANLELMTPSENTRHAFTHIGKKPNKNPNHGQKNGRAKLTDTQAADIYRRYHAGGASQQKLADEFGVHQTSISRIVRGVGWASVDTP